LERRRRGGAGSVGVAVALLQAAPGALYAAAPRDVVVLRDGSRQSGQLKACACAQYAECMGQPNTCPPPATPSGPLPGE
jgi:hypothetical protein